MNNYLRPCNKLAGQYGTKRRFSLQSVSTQSVNKSYIIEHFVTMKIPPLLYDKINISNNTNIMNTGI